MLVSAPEISALKKFENTKTILINRFPVGEDTNRGIKEIVKGFL